MSLKLPHKMRKSLSDQEALDAFSSRQHELIIPRTQSRAYEFQPRKYTNEEIISSEHKYARNQSLIRYISLGLIFLLSVLSIIFLFVLPAVRQSNNLFYYLYDTEGIVTGSTVFSSVNSGYNSLNNNLLFMNMFGILIAMLAFITNLGVSVWNLFSTRKHTLALRISITSLFLIGLFGMLTGLNGAGYIIALVFSFIYTLYLTAIVFYEQRRLPNLVLVIVCALVCGLSVSLIFGNVNQVYVIDTDTTYSGLGLIRLMQDFPNAINGAVVVTILFPILFLIFQYVICYLRLAKPYYVSRYLLVMEWVVIVFAIASLICPYILVSDYQNNVVTQVPGQETTKDAHMFASVGFYPYLGVISLLIAMSDSYFYINNGSRLDRLIY